MSKETCIYGKTGLFSHAVSVDIHRVYRSSRYMYTGKETCTRNLKEACQKNLSKKV